MSVSMGLPAAKASLVLDTWPVMEWLKDSEGVAERFDRLLAMAENAELTLVISRITIGEIFYVTAKEYGLASAESLLLLTREWFVTIAEASEERVLDAARLKAQHAISYADAFVAALAAELRAPVITGDEDFLKLEQAGVLRVEWLGV